MTSRQTPEAWMRVCQNQHNWKTTRSRVPAGGVDSFDRVGYYGPCLSPGHGNHRYYFRLYALDLETLSMPPDATWFQVEKAMEGHVLGTAETMGTFSR